MYLITHSIFLNQIFDFKFVNFIKIKEKYFIYLLIFVSCIKKVRFESSDG